MGCRRSWRVDPRAALLRQQLLQGLSGRPPSELARRPLPDRFANSEDDRVGSDLRQGGCRVIDRYFKQVLHRNLIRQGASFGRSLRVGPITAVLQASWKGWRWQI